MHLFTKTFELLWPRRRRQGLLLLGLMCVGAILETVGVGLIIPALALMTQGNLSDIHPFFGSALDVLGNPRPERLVVLGMSVLVGAYAAKTAFVAFVTWKQARFVAQVRSDLSQRLFASYIRQPYAFHLNRNSAGLMYNATVHPQAVAAVAQHFLMLLTESFVLVGISILLVAVEPVGTVLTMSFIGAAGWLFNRVTKRRTIQWGHAYKLQESRRYQQLQQGFGGVKEIKVMGREKEFLTQYDLATTTTARAQAHRSFLQGVPRLWLELLAITAFAGLVFLLVQRGQAMETLVPTIGLFAVAAFRVMPSVNRVLGAVHGIRFDLPLLDAAHAEIKLIGDPAPAPDAPPLSFARSIELEGVTYRYPGAGVDALADVSLAIARGTSVGFVGGSGAGKSTLVDVTLGLLTPVSGRVTVDGTDVMTNLRGWQQQIGYVPQHIFLVDDSLRRNVAFGFPDDEIDEEAVRRAVRAAQLEEFVSAQPQGLDTAVGERGVRLSGGQRQRIGIARALYHNPAVLVLDEATSSLDAATERGVMQAVQSLHGEKTVLIVTHRLSTVADCDQIFRLEGGRLVEHGDARILVNLG